MIKNVLWDFDGVILNSMPIREYGFRRIFENFDDKLVDQLIEYHNSNGGLSRFHKIKYFYNKLLRQEISEAEIQRYANKFSEIMKKELTDKKYLIDETVKFIKDNHEKLIFHIVSGSEQNELRYLCQELGIGQYFKSIQGSPTHKNELVKNILDETKYNIDEFLLIGDSINDYEAAKINKIKFYGYNNPELKYIGHSYIYNYQDLNFFDA